MLRGCLRLGAGMSMLWRAGLVSFGCAVVAGVVGG